MTKINHGIEQPYFKLGALIVTRLVNTTFTDSEIVELIKRHAQKDWGDLDADDEEENNFSLENGYRILSSYQTAKGKIWIITEADRTQTTILFPEEY